MRRVDRIRSCSSGRFDDGVQWKGWVPECSERFDAGVQWNGWVPACR